MRFTNLAIAVGVVAWMFLVLNVLGARVDYQLILAVEELPPDDEKLRDWFSRQPGVKGVEVRRREGDVEVSYSRLERVGHDPYLKPPLRELGYGNQRAIKQTTKFPPTHTRLIDALSSPTHLVALLGCIAASLGVFWGLGKLFARRREGAGGPAA